MSITTDRYASPGQPPRLIVSTPSPAGADAIAPRLSLHSRRSASARPLITFEWGRVAPSRYAR